MMISASVNAGSLAAFAVTMQKSAVPIVLLKFFCLHVYVLLGSSNVGETLPTGQLSNIPWRRAAVKYTNNEAYFDVVEEVDAILDKSGIIGLM